MYHRGNSKGIKMLKPSFIAVHGLAMKNHH